MPRKKPKKPKKPKKKMAAPTYATDLTVIDDFESGDNTLEPSATWTAGRGNTTDTDYPIQSSTHASLIMNTTGKAGLLTDASPVTWTSGDYLFGWIIWLAPGAIGTQAQGGLAMLAGSAAGAYKVFYVGGKDWGLYPYGGWQNFAVDPELSADETIGSPDGDFDFVGGGANVLTSVAKGSPLGIDVFRSGRGEFRVYNGDGTTPATFSGMAAANDASTARWGLFQAIAGSYKFKGLMVLGYSAAVTFVDSNKNIVIDDMIYVNSDFNGVEIRNASSSVSWTNITMESINTTSPGTFEVVDNATVTLAGCSFINMGTFTFLSNSTVSSAFRGCGQVTPNGADMTDSIVAGYEGTADTSALIWNVATDPNGLLDGMRFTKGTAATHAIEFGTSSPLTMTLTDCVFNSYGADGTTSAALHIKRTAGTVTINYNGTVPTYKSDGATVVLVSSKTATFTPVDNGSAFTITRNSDNFLLHDVSSTTGGQVVYSYDGALDGTAATVHIIIVGKEPIDFPWTVAEGTVPISQVTDRIYSNP